MRSKKEVTMKPSRLIVYMVIALAAALAAFFFLVKEPLDGPINLIHLLFGH